MCVRVGVQYRTCVCVCVCCVTFVMVCGNLYCKCIGQSMWFGAALSVAAVVFYVNILPEKISHALFLSGRFCGGGTSLHAIDGTGSLCE